MMLETERLIWCAYFDGNDKSRRVMEKCGFKYHHSNEKIKWERTNSVLTEHVTCLTVEEWRKTI